MSSNDEVLFHELYWPRISGKMQRRGIYRRCGCAGCPPCRDAARRMLRGIVRSPQQSVPFRPDVWGDRYRVFSRALGERTYNVLTDMSAQPTVVDVNVADSSADPNDANDANDAPAYDSPHDSGVAADADADTSVAEELSLRQLIAQRVPGNPTLANKVLGMTVTDDAGAKLDLRTIQLSKPRSMDDLAKRAGLNQIPAQSGIYLLQWPGGQYLGMGNNLQHRIRSHLQGLKRFTTDLRPFRLFYAVLKGDVRATEKAILQSLLRLSGPASESVESRFLRLGMTNQQTEFESFER